MSPSLAVSYLQLPVAMLLPSRIESDREPILSIILVHDKQYLVFEQLSGTTSPLEFCQNRVHEWTPRFQDDLHVISAESEWIQFVFISGQFVCMKKSGEGLKHSRLRKSTKNGISRSPKIMQSNSHTMRL